MLADQVVVEVVFGRMDVDYRMSFLALSEADLNGKTMHHYHPLYRCSVHEDCLQSSAHFEAGFHAHYGLLALCLDEVLFLHVFQLKVDCQSRDVIFEPAEDEFCIVVVNHYVVLASDLC